MRRAVRPTTILSDARVRILTKRVSDLLRASFPGIDWGKRDPEAGIRLMALAAKCKEAREKQGLSIRDVAGQLRVPQYRLKAIEKASQSELRPQYLRRYTDFLGLKRWTRRWIAANAALAERLEISDL